MLEKIDESEYGRFAWVIDPEGNKVELWQSRAGLDARVGRSSRIRWALGDRVMPSTAYRVHEVSVAARPVAGVRAQVPRGRVAQEFRRYLDQVYAAARAGAVHLDGQNVFVYRGATADVLTVDFCVGVTAPFATVGAVEPLQTPHGVAAMTTHIGEYGRLGEANAAILAWCRAHGRALAGPSWEVYGHWNDDPAQLRTEVYHLLEPVGAKARS